MGIKAKKTKQEKRIARMIKANRSMEYDYSEGIEEIHKQLIEKYIHTSHISSDEHIKMSEVILIYALPFIKQVATTPETFDTAIKYAIMVWNLGLLPEDNRTEYLEMFYEGIQTVFGGGISHEENTGIMNILLERQKMLFPNVKRIISGCEIVGKGKDSILNISSSALNDIPNDPSAA